ncbi:AmmeMemoRadiSam system protein A [Candidatus Thiosymbion oneisti]|uniref:AmmeMemoRadiSam system protein A n=1 Tax=Candidatus Thiosymbion oneisti TaxID=589554 RepID=UPI000A486B1C|nr:AmmeMemoRadiSam system protein A [Candidatus Thiosymbion oneisti]
MSLNRAIDPDPLDPSQRRTLLALARQSIAHGLDQGGPLPVVPSDYPADLRERRAAFVTLETGGTLRGCIGHLEAIQPLVSDVAENAFAAAFRDPRFRPLTRPELARLSIEISVLTPSQPLSFTSEEELLRMIEPGRDGLILEAGAARGTFLPTVWESLPEPRAFLRHLKQKAGLRPDYWSDRVRVRRYRTESFSE